jgi:hypothetical protein
MPRRIQRWLNEVCMRSTWVIDCVVRAVVGQTRDALPRRVVLDPWRHSGMPELSALSRVLDRRVAGALGIPL